MGWTGILYPQYDKRGKIDRKKTLRKEFNSDTLRIVKDTLIGTTYYAAVEHIGRLMKDENGKYIEANGRYKTEIIPEAEREVFGLVCLTTVDKGELIYKEMSEDIGPYYFDCPSSILDLLSPTDNECANEWRRKCREHTKKKKLLQSMNIGSKIRIIWNNEPIILEKQSPSCQFKSTWWRCTEGGYIKKKNIPLNFEIVA